MTDTTGKLFDLREEIAGNTTLVFFGYANCPDVCPTVMGDISLALSKQPKGISAEESTTHHDGTVTSDHGAQVAAFLPGDDKAHVVYTSGTTTDDYARDLPLLAKSAR
ncbi:SCO family protein [Streptomyces sp. NPDC093808]|uniref:SCO family protein n=1 Tax=Streptomyces sp. NPDC093808 TaxID=3154985 RepID=UPI00344F5A8C